VTVAVWEANISSKKLPVLFGHVTCFLTAPFTFGGIVLLGLHRFVEGAVSQAVVLCCFQYSIQLLSSLGQWDASVVDQHQL